VNIFGDDVTEITSQLFFKV